jgi:endoglucanase
LLKFPGPNDPEADAMVKFWAALAKHLAQHDPERVFLEVANEPGLDNPLDWYAVEVRILKAMRENAPRHTLIAGYNMRASKNDWDGVKALTLFPALADKNVVFNFHYYHPMTLTHQGAPWVKSVTSRVHDVPYPADPAVLDPLIAKAEDSQIKRALERYREEGWNRKKVETELAIVGDWAKQRGVFATCNEFGVYRKVAPLSARVDWTRDVRESLEKLGIGWTIWDSTFGFLSRQDGQASVDGNIAQALGLKVP